MATQIDKEACREAYNDVRDDSTETNWWVDVWFKSIQPPLKEINVSDTKTNIFDFGRPLFLTSEWVYFSRHLNALCCPRWEMPPLPRKPGSAAVGPGRGRGVVPEQPRNQALRGRRNFLCPVFKGFCGDAQSCSLAAFGMGVWGMPAACSWCFNAAVLLFQGRL